MLCIISLLKDVQQFFSLEDLNIVKDLVHQLMLSCSQSPFQDRRTKDCKIVFIIKYSFFLAFFLTFISYCLSLIKTHSKASKKYSILPQRSKTFSR